MPPNCASEAQGSVVQLCSLQGDGYIFIHASNCIDLVNVSIFLHLLQSDSKTYYLFQSCMGQSKFVHLPCRLSKQRVQIGPEWEGKKREEKCFTAMQPSSVPCGRDGMSRAQEAMKEDD